MIIDVFDTGLFHWTRTPTSYLEVIFVLLLCMGAVNAQDVVWGVSVGLVTLLVFLARLYNSCKGQFTLAPFSDSDISRLKSCHFVFVGQTFADMQWLLDDLMSIFDTDEFGFLSGEIYFSRETEASLHTHLAHRDNRSWPQQLQLKIRRPHWRSIFKNLARSRYEDAETPPVVGVFFCGAVAMGRAVSAAAQSYSARASSTISRFLFKMENF
jgi:hypothetical protein